MARSANRRRGGGALAVAALVIAGCAAEADETPVADADADTSAARSVAVADTESTVPALADPTVNPEGVIFAAITLETGGDVDAAMADGMFTRDDLDAARDGIADGSLSYLFD